MMDFPLTLAAIFRHAEQVHPRREIVTRRPDGSLHRHTYADFAARVSLNERLASTSPPAFEAPDQQRIYEVTQSAVQAIADEAEDRCAHDAGIGPNEQRGPHRCAEP